MRARAGQDCARDRSWVGRLRRPRAASGRALHRHHQLGCLAELSQIEARQFRRQLRHPAHRFLRLRTRRAVRLDRHHGRDRAPAQYERVLKKFYRLLKPGGRVFLDGSAWKKKYELSTFMVRHIYPGNHSFLVLDDFLNKMFKTDFEVDVIHNDRWSYYLTFKQWAMNLDAHKEYIQRTFGDFEFRKFRLYLWGATYEFLHRNLDCYRLILSKPKAQHHQKGSPCVSSAIIRRHLPCRVARPFSAWVPRLPSPRSIAPVPTKPCRSRRPPTQ